MIRTAEAGKGVPGLAWVIHPDAIPEGDTLLITTQLANEGQPVATHDGKAIFAVDGSTGLADRHRPACSGG